MHRSPIVAILSGILPLLASCTTNAPIPGFDAAVADAAIVEVDATILPDSAESPDASLETIESFCPYYATAMASRLAECQGGTTAAWMAIIERDKICDNLIKAVNAGRAAYDKTQAAACLAVLPTSDCYTAGRSRPGACAAVFVGTVPADGDCYGFADCQANLRCTSGFSVCPGKCQALKGLGETCDNQEDCIDTAGCGFDEGAGHKICKARGAQGDTCLEIEPRCQPELWCFGRSDHSGSCIVPPTTCTDCCDENAACMPRSYCAPPAAGPITPDNPGDCQARRHLGESCVAGAGNPPCENMTACIGGQCVLYAAIGESCADGRPCLTGWCPASGDLLCQPPLAPGANCTSNQQCGNGQCGPGNTCQQPCHEP